MPLGDRYEPSSGRKRDVAATTGERHQRLPAVVEDLSNLIPFLARTPRKPNASSLATPTPTPQTLPSTSSLLSFDLTSKAYTLDSGGVFTFAIMATTDIIVADDLKAALKSVADVRDQSLTLLDLVKTVHQESPNGPTLEQNTALTKADKLLRAHLAQLRGRNRKAILNTRATKQGTGVWRQEVDELHLSLQNLYYEQRHLRGEIAACKNYK